MAGAPTDPRDALIGQARDKARIPSFVAATFWAGQVDWRCTLGETATAYRIASITKTFTAATVMQLRDEGRIDLDDQLARHVPDAPYGDHTVRRLLAHASGMTAEPTGPWWERVPGGSWDELVTSNQETTNVFGPGERYHYSNLGYGLLGEMVSRLRGAGWWDVVTRRLLEPLGLTETSYDAPVDAALGTSRHPVTGNLMREPSEDQRAMAPAGQLWSSAEDLARWADFLVTGRPGVLAPHSLLEMRTVQSGDPDLQHRGCYGLGLRLRWAPSATLVGHTGSLPGFLAGLFVDPVTRVGAMVLANATSGLDPEGLCAELIEATAPAAGPAALVPDASSPASDLGGPWYWGNVAMELVATSAGPVISVGTSRSRFEHIGGDTYRGLNGYWAGERLNVHRDADGTPRFLEVVTFVLTRTPYDPAAPIPGRMPEPT